MRLPWPFGRGTTSGGSASELGGGSPTGGGPSPDEAAPRPSSDAPPSGAWASLPPIQRTVAAAPLVAPAAPFLDRVPGHRPLPPIVQPLGHESAPSAPAGLVVAHPTPVASLTSTAAMPTRHVQRRTSGAHASGASGWPEPAEGPAVDHGHEGPAADVVADAPVRQLSAVAPAQTVTPPARPLTVAPPLAAAPAPVAQRSRATGSTSAPSAGSAALALPSTTATVASEPALPLASKGTPPARTGSRWSESPHRPGLGAPLSAAPGSVPAPAPGAASTTATGAGPAPSAQLELAHRPGLGAPLTSLPGTAAPTQVPSRPLVQRLAATHAATTGARPTTGPLPPELLPAAPAPTPRAGNHHEAHTPPAAARPLPTLPVARPRGERVPVAPETVQRQASTPVPTAGAPGQARPTTPTAAASHAGASPVVLPLAGSRPLRPSVPLQREAEGEEAAPSVAHLPVPARWGAGDDLPATVHATDRPAPAPDAVPLQRFAAPDAAAPQPVPAPSVATPSDGWRGAHSPALGSPSLAASAGPLRAAGSTPAPAPVTRTATASPAPTLQLARPPAAAPAPVVVVPAPAAPPAGRIEAPVVSPSAPAPTVQTSPAAGASGLPAFTATPVVQREPGTAPPVQGGQTGHTDRELDELAKQLFGRVRGRLRAEMISEREARGLSFDAF